MRLRRRLSDCQQFPSPPPHTHTAASVSHEERGASSGAALCFGDGGPPGLCAHRRFSMTPLSFPPRADGVSSIQMYSSPSPLRRSAADALVRLFRTLLRLLPSQTPSLTRRHLCICAERLEGCSVDSDRRGCGSCSGPIGACLATRQQHTYTTEVICVCLRTDTRSGVWAIWCRPLSLVSYSANHVRPCHRLVIETSICVCVRSGGSGLVEG